MIKVEDPGPIWRMIFGSHPDPSDVARWKSQSFSFSSETGKRFCLLQTQGGPCGVLAPLQALILKEVVFTHPKVPLTSLPDPTDDELYNALVSSLGFTLARCAADGLVMATVNGEDIHYMQFTSVEDYMKTVKEMFSDTLDSSEAVLQFVVSLILTRGLETLKLDMDDFENPMVGRFGHCSQELVNLMLTGKATSNVFDGQQDLGDGLLLRGVSAESPLPIGYLSELESLRYITVGNTFKFPTYPLWIVGSSTHYTVLFGLKFSDAAVSNDRAVNREIRRAFNAHAFDDGICMSDKLPLVLKELELSPQLLERASLDQGGVVIFSDFAAWARSTLGLAETSNETCEYNLYLLNGLEPVALSRVNITSAYPLVASDQLFVATIQTRWPETNVQVLANQ